MTIVLRIYCTAASYSVLMGRNSGKQWWPRASAAVLQDSIYCPRRAATQTCKRTERYRAPPTAGYWWLREPARQLLPLGRAVPRDARPVTAVRGDQLPGRPPRTWSRDGSTARGQRGWRPVGCWVVSTGTSEAPRASSRGTCTRATRSAMLRWRSDQIPMEVLRGRYARPQMPHALRHCRRCALAEVEDNTIA
jgi:hypothetical protein